MENVILKSLAFDLAVPTVLSFLERYGKSVNLPHRLTEKFSHLTKVSWCINLFEIYYEPSYKASNYTR